jgi:hypothetical protein
MHFNAHIEHDHSKQKPVVIAVDGEPQGIAVSVHGGFRFIAVRLPVFYMDGQLFPSIHDARAAAIMAVRLARPTWRGVTPA